MNELDMINALIAAGHSGSLEEIKKKLEPKKRGAWRPGLGGWYYFIYSADSVIKTNNDVYAAVDNFRIGTGNCYQTQEEAKIALKIINRIIELRDGWTPNWDDREEVKYGIERDHYYKIWEYFCVLNSERIGGIVLPTKEAAKALIDEFGDDLFLISGRI